VRAGEGLESFFAPRSIAIVGASQDETKIGGRPVQFLLKHGFAGNIYPVNRSAAEVQSLRAYPSVRDLPETPDLAIIAVPAEAAVDALAACAEKGVLAAVILSSGFSELGETGLAQQRRLTEIARASGMRVLGPNCLGSIGMKERAIATFSIALEGVLPVAGPIAIASQSGNLGSFTMRLAAERGMGIGRFITTGNECDVDLADAIAFLADDPSISLILCCMETCRNAARLVEALAKARAARKPVIVLKIGSSAVGQAAAASHTGAMAGSDAVFSAVFAQWGATRVRNLEEFLNLGHAAALLLPDRLPTGRRVALVTASGGFGVMMADAATAAGLELPQLGASTQQKILAAVPGAAPHNPVDATAQMSSRPAVMEKILSAVVDDEGIDATLQLLAGSLHLPRLRSVFLETLRSLREQRPDRLLVLCTKGPPDAIAELNAMGYATADSIDAACAMLAQLEALGRIRREEPAIPGETVVQMQKLAPEIFLHEAGAKAALAKAGLPVPTERIAVKAEDAMRAARDIGYPVVLKILSPDLAHKTEVGGVAVNLRDDDEVRSAHDTMLARVRDEAPDARIAGVLVAPMMGGGVELIIGTKKDPIFGPVVMAGLGGIFAELLRDSAVRPAPVDEAGAMEMLRSLNAFPVLVGARGRPASDLQAAAAAIANLSRFASAHVDEIEEIDINPLLVMQQGRGAAVLDALVIGAGGSYGAPRS
jgi:acyl-CoA synthetase (NDP forming)